MDVEEELIDQKLEIKNLKKEQDEMKAVIKHDLIHLINLYSEQKKEIRILKQSLGCYKPEISESDGRVGIYG